jgi:hypothetical protein
VRVRVQHPHDSRWESWHAREQYVLLWHRTCAGPCESPLSHRWRAHLLGVRCARQLLSNPGHVRVSMLRDATGASCGCLSYCGGRDPQARALAIGHQPDLRIGFEHIRSKQTIVPTSLAGSKRPGRTACACKLTSFLRYHVRFVDFDDSSSSQVLQNGDESATVGIRR